MVYKIFFCNFFFILINHCNFFSIETKVIYFLVYSPEKVNWLLNSSASFFYDKMIIIIRSIMKNYRNVFRYTVFQITYTMQSMFIIPCIMTMITSFMIFVIFQIIIFKFLWTNITNFCINI